MVWKHQKTTSPNTGLQECYTFKSDARVRGKTLILTGYVFETGSGPHGCSGERGYPVEDIGTLCGCS